VERVGARAEVLEEFGDQRFDVQQGAHVR
jgi:hypothetical protein